MVKKIQIFCIFCVRWCAPVVPATWEDEAGELLEPRRQRLQRAEIAPLHSSPGDRARLHLRKKKKERKKKKKTKQEKQKPKASVRLELAGRLTLTLNPPMAPYCPMKNVLTGTSCRQTWPPPICPSATSTGRVRNLLGALTLLSGHSFAHPML